MKRLLSRVCSWFAVVVFGVATPTAMAQWYGPVTNPANDSQYYVLETAMTHTNALAYARTNISPSANPAIIRSAAENTWVVNNLVVPTGNQFGYWIGGQRVNNTPGAWSFLKIIGDVGGGTDGTTRADPSRYTNWNAGEPSDTGGAEDHVILLGNAGTNQGQWNDVNINAGISVYRMIVEVPRDCNNDGVPDMAQAGPMDTGMVSFHDRQDWLDLPNDLIPYNTVASQPDGDLTIEFWFRTTVGGPILSDTNQVDPPPYGPSAGWSMPYAYVGTDGKLRMAVWWGNSTVLTTPSAVNDGSWHHAAMTLAYTNQTTNAATATMYLDGAQVAQQNVTVGTTTLTRGTYLGLWQSLTGWPGGWGEGWKASDLDLAEFRVWTTARTQAEVQDNRFASVTGQSGLRVYYRFVPALAGNQLRVVYDLAGSNDNALVTGYGVPQVGVNWPTFVPVVTDINSSGPPTIIGGTQGDVHVCELFGTSLFMFATGLNVTYQWVKDGVDINGANQNIYTVPSGSGISGQYWCRVTSNPCGSSVNGPQTTLTSSAPPVFTLQPVSQTVACGSDVTIQVIATSTPSPAYYEMFRWDLSYVASSLDGTFVIPNMQPSQSMDYFITANHVIQHFCRTFSDNFTLTITQPCPQTCDSIDFNNDTSMFDPQDIDAFLSVYSEGPCVPTFANCNDIDFNNDGSLFDPCDIDSFLLQFSEGPCTLCGV